MSTKIKEHEQSGTDVIREVCRVRSTRPYKGRGLSRIETADRRRNPNCAEPIGKEQTHVSALPPDYVAGFIDGEGSFSVCINRQKTTRSGIEIRPEFAIELRADDREILERIMVTVGCGKLYDCLYERYGWFPHVKYRISSYKLLVNYLIPFLDQHPLQVKKAETYRLFREIVLMVYRKEHLTTKGLKRIVELRKQIRKFGKKQKMGTARIRENRSSGGVRRNT
ncbi:MAG: hypothetical protein A3E37_02665 [Candidatus Andersenbacteria bacterium RIFCSPHIGHO2_12_FULL_46_9]|nr:MAG: hypothetical protein A3B76_00745 [Candidatus Andersenbacteria bacterium RIFCSPHIGHO2_02_FULL_46_16]OGY37419.1 MAG: hypothetical protein A3E37_02665 [Candidatus Andersenbacteria bacterium RIFCSPHIGHO2_12_FULL_46_9]OGY37441.1 MAG: hypothetical protein A3I08_00150 [Candidatus Andersenbacteria bacterium RIFCSPLOWO2_02_FULL_46_11]